jgi:hypothetical protein
MKKIMTFTFIILMLAKAVIAAPVPDEVSALLLSEQYSAIAKQVTERANQNGRTIKISNCNVETIADKKFVYLNLSQKITADLNSPWVPAGAIVGNVVYGPMGEIGFDGVYYQPPSELPGGATVGN